MDKALYGYFIVENISATERKAESKPESKKVELVWDVTTA